MTISEFAAIVGSYKFHPCFPYQIRLDARRGIGHVGIQGYCTAIDVTTDRTTMITLSDVVDERMLEFMTSEMVHVMIYAFLKRFVLHELDESIIVDGVRKYDPHKEEKR